MKENGFWRFRSKILPAPFYFPEVWPPSVQVPCHRPKTVNTINHCHPPETVVMLGESKATLAQMDQGCDKDSRTPKFQFAWTFILFWNIVGDDSYRDSVFCICQKQQVFTIVFFRWIVDPIPVSTSRQPSQRSRPHIWDHGRRCWHVRMWQGIQCDGRQDQSLSGQYDMVGNRAKVQEECILCWCASHSKRWTRSSGHQQRVPTWDCSKIHLQHRSSIKYITQSFNNLGQVTSSPDLLMQNVFSITTQPNGLVQILNVNVRFQKLKLSFNWCFNVAIRCGDAEDIKGGITERKCQTYGCRWLNMIERREAHNSLFSTSYSCLPGYYLEGKKERFCQANGTWLPKSLPQCIRKKFLSWSLRTILKLLHSNKLSDTRTSHEWSGCPQFFNFQLSGWLRVWLWIYDSWWEANIYWF